MRELIKARNLKLGDMIDLAYPDTEPRPWMQAMVIKLDPGSDNRGVVPTVYRIYLTHAGATYGGVSSSTYIISYIGSETFNLDPGQEVLRIGVNPSR